MERLILYIIFFCFSFFSYSQGFPLLEIDYISIFPGTKEIMIKNEVLVYNDYGGVYEYEGIKYPKQLIIENPEIKKESSISFIFNGKIRSIILLRDDLICICLAPTLAKGLDVPLFIGIKAVAEGQYELTDPHMIKASSVLKEGDRVYDAGSLWKIRLEHPWSEGVPGPGIGEWLAFRLGSDTDRVGKPVGVYLINGYLSFDHPERYTNNGRIRKMTLTSLKTGKSRQFDVQDTPNPQFFPTEELGGYEFKLTIDEVYPGEKYEDTCVSGILSLDVPWNGPTPEDFYEISPLLRSPH